MRRWRPARWPYIKESRAVERRRNYRYLGNYPLSSGPCMNSAALRTSGPGDILRQCADRPGQVDGKGFGEVTSTCTTLYRGVGAPLSGSTIYSTPTRPRPSFGTSIAWQNEIGAYPDGRADVHEHPLGPHHGPFYRHEEILNSPLGVRCLYSGVCRFQGGSMGGRLSEVSRRLLWTDLRYRSIKARRRV